MQIKNLQKNYFTKLLNISYQKKLINKNVYNFYKNNEKEMLNYTIKYNTLFADISLPFIKKTFKKNIFQIDLDLFLKQLNIYANSIYIRLLYNPNIKDIFFIKIYRNLLENKDFQNYSLFFTKSLKEIKKIKYKIDKIIELQLTYEFFTKKEIIQAFEEFLHTNLNKKHSLLFKTDDNYFLNFDNIDDPFFFRIQNHEDFINQKNINFDSLCLKSIKKSKWSFFPPKNLEKYFNFKFIFLQQNSQKLLFFPQTLLFYKG